MTTTVQSRRGSTNDHMSFIGQPGEITVDTDLWSVRVHDGVTPGGHLAGGGGGTSPSMVFSSSFDGLTYGFKNMDGTPIDSAFMDWQIHSNTDQNVSLDPGTGKNLSLMMSGSPVGYVYELVLTTTLTPANGVPAGIMSYGTALMPSSLNVLGKQHTVHTSNLDVTNIADLSNAPTFLNLAASQVQWIDTYYFVLEPDTPSSLYFLTAAYYPADTLETISQAQIMGSLKLLGPSASLPIPVAF